MHTETITLDRKQALQLYRDYKKHAHWSAPIDHEIRRTYQLIAQGRVIIKALESIKAAGLNEQRLPKLALTRADFPLCRLRRHGNGSATMYGIQEGDSKWSEPKGASRSFRFPVESFPNIVDQRWSYEAIVPIVPVHLRPKRGIANYHILWEAEWSKRIPVDPMLLRRIGKGDMWLVVAAWDLTEVERAALSARVGT